MKRFFSSVLSLLLGITPVMFLLGAVSFPQGLFITKYALSKETVSCMAEANRMSRRIKRASVGADYEEETRKLATEQGTRLSSFMKKVSECNLTMKDLDTRVSNFQKKKTMT